MGGKGSEGTRLGPRPCRAFPSTRKWAGERGAACRGDRTPLLAARLAFPDSLCKCPSPGLRPLLARGPRGQLWPAAWWGVPGVGAPRGLQSQAPGTSPPARHPPERSAPSAGVCLAVTMPQASRAAGSRADRAHGRSVSRDPCKGRAVAGACCSCEDG